MGDDVPGAAVAAALLPPRSETEVGGVRTWEGVGVWRKRDGRTVVGGRPGHSARPPSHAHAPRPSHPTRPLPAQGISPSVLQEYLDALQARREAAAAAAYAALAGGGVARLTSGG